MALTGDSLTDEVQALCGRTDDTVLITDARVARWLNEGQRDVAGRVVGINSLNFKNITSTDFTQTLSYALTEWTVGDETEQGICHIHDAFYVDGADSIRLQEMFTDEFDLAYPDPTHSDIAFNKPTHWTRRGNSIEIFPVPACSYVDKDFRMDGDFYPEDFTTNDTTYSDICGADEGLISFALSKAWRAIGEKAKSDEAKVDYEVWLAGYREQNDIIHAWDGNLYGQGVD